MDTEPLVRITHGNPAPDEVAALVGVVLARLRAAQGGPAVVASRWARSARPGATVPRPGARAWRAAAQPR